MCVCRAALTAKLLLLITMFFFVILWNFEQMPCKIDSTLTYLKIAGQSVHIIIFENYSNKNLKCKTNVYHII